MAPDPTPSPNQAIEAGGEAQLVAAVAAAEAAAHEGVTTSTDAEGNPTRSRWCSLELPLTPLYLPISPHISPYLPISPHISPYLARCSMELKEARAALEARAADMGRYWEIWGDVGEI